MNARVHLLTSVATLRYSRAAFFILNHNPEGTQAGLNLGAWSFFHRNHQRTSPSHCSLFFLGFAALLF